MTSKERSRSDISSALQSLIDQSIDTGVPGTSAQISSSVQGTLWTSTSGSVDLSADAPVSTNHLFGIGSITKVFVTVVILQLVEEQKLRLDDKIGNLLPLEVYKEIENAPGATVAALLSHTAGLDSWEDDPVWITHGRGRELDPEKIWSKTETLEYVRRPNTSGPSPGTFSYSNTNFTLLGLIVEAISHQTAESEIRRRILEPLGMTNTYLEGFEEPTTPNISPRRYHWNTAEFRSSAGICPSFTLQRNNLIDATGSNLSVEWTAGGLVSSPSDLTKFAIALRDGKLLTPSSLNVMKDWRPARESMEMGHGLFRVETPRSTGRWLGHFGGVLGFSAAWLWKEDGDCVVCVLANVGSMHAGKVPSGMAELVLGSDFLKLAGDLAACESR